MFFTQIDFVVFFLLLLGCLVCISGNTFRKVILLAASYYFYAHWDYRFLGLILISTVVDYHVGKLLAKENTLRRRRLWLGLSIVVNLGILAAFKYANFFISSLAYLVRPLGLDYGTLNLILPLGISFYTFKTLSYVFDSYRHRIDPCASLLDYALFVGFFPTMVAGPIVRASQFLPQLKTKRPITVQNLLLGFRLFAIGLFMKVFVADGIAGYVNYVLDNAAVFDSGTIWLAVIGYSFQLYCDFAGYTSMAVGVGKILGYDLPENFNFPYLSRNINEFWQRWHITLGSWIRDYIYIPLGGNRKGAFRTHLNLVVSMMLCGLWHGAAWTFVFWGLLHGVALTVNRMWAIFRVPVRDPGSGPVFLRFLGWLTTLLTVVVGWVFFRARDFEHAGLLLEKMFYPQGGVIWYYPFVLFVLAFCILIHLEELSHWQDFHRLPITAWYTPVTLFTMIWLCVIFYPKGFNPFIYAQF